MCIIYHRPSGFKVKLPRWSLVAIVKICKPCVDYCRLGLRPPYIILIRLDGSILGDWFEHDLIPGAWSRIRLTGPVDPDPITSRANLQYLQFKHQFVGTDGINIGGTTCTKRRSKTSG